MTVESPALRLVRRGGGRPAVVVLHAFASSGAEWSAVIDGLAADHLCLAPDLRGFGASGAAPGHDVAAHADDVLALVAAEVEGPWILAGHSMGGKIALAAAARRPAGLVGLALLAPSPPTPEPIADDDRAMRLTQHGDAAAARATLADTSVGAVGPDAAARFVRDSLACSAGAWAWWLERGSREDLSALVDRIAVPVLVLLGDADPVIPRDVLDASLGRLRSGLEVVILPGAGHQLPLERPAECAALLRDFAQAGMASGGVAGPDRTG